MRLIIAIMLFASISGAAMAATNVVSNKNFKNAFNLNVQQPEAPAPAEKPCCDYTGTDEQNVANKNVLSQFKLQPEFKYTKENDDYNPRNDVYDTQLKLKLNLDF